MSTLNHPDKLFLPLNGTPAEEGNGTHEATGLSSRSKKEKQNK